MIGQWLHSGTTIKEKILSKWYWLALACAAAAAAIFLVWLHTDAQSVAFVYSEF